MYKKGEWVFTANVDKTPQFLLVPASQLHLAEKQGYLALPESLAWGVCYSGTTQFNTN